MKRTSCRFSVCVLLLLLLLLLLCNDKQARRTWLCALAEEREEAQAVGRGASGGEMEKGNREGGVAKPPSKQASKGKTKTPRQCNVV